MFGVGMVWRTMNRKNNTLAPVLGVDIGRVIIERDAEPRGLMA